MKPLRVVHVAHNFPPEFRGGVERLVESAALSQKAAGLDVSIVCGSERSKDEPTAETGDHCGVRTTRLYRGPAIRDPIDPFRADLAPLYEDFLRREKPDVVHVHHWANLGDDLVRRAVRNGARVVVTLHDFFTTCALYFRTPDGSTPCDLPQGPETCGPCVAARFHVGVEDVAGRVEMRRLAFLSELSAAAVATAPSEAHRAALLRFLPSPIDVRVVPIGSSPIAPARRKKPDGRLRVLHFGNLCRLKGVETLARAVERADPEAKAIDLRLVGDLVESDLDLGRATRASGYDAESLRAEAEAADVAAFPSNARETYGLTLDEALRLGLPVLVSDRGALAERIGTRGRVLPAGDVDSWAAELRRLADDPSALDALRSGAHAPLCDSDDFARRLIEIYDEVRDRPLPNVDLEDLMLRRLAAFERALGTLLAARAVRERS
jgi:glycosyltransferase involved in cell wall biosynthesis